MADSQGHDAPEASQGTGAPEAPTEQKPSTLSLDDVNRAITARQRDFDKKIEAKLQEHLTNLGKSLESRIAEMLAPKAPGDSDVPDGKPEAKQADGKAKDPDVVALKSEITKLKNAQLEIERQRQAEIAKRRDIEMRQLVTERLAAYGITGSRAKHALGYLVDATRTIGVDENGSPYFRGSDGEPLDVETGLKSWSSTEDAKIYLPPRGIAGSGDRTTTGGGLGPTGNGPKNPREELQQLVGKAFGIGG